MAQECIATFKKSMHRVFSSKGRFIKTGLSRLRQVEPLKILQILFN